MCVDVNVFSCSSRTARHGRKSKHPTKRPIVSTDDGKTTDDTDNVIQTDTGKTTDTETTASATPTSYNRQNSGKAKGDVTKECKSPGKVMDHNVRDGEALKEQGHVVHPDQVIHWCDRPWVSYHGIC